jgi:hypothetical protein
MFQSHCDFVLKGSSRFQAVCVTRVMGSDFSVFMLREVLSFKMKARVAVNDFPGFHSNLFIARLR